MIHINFHSIFFMNSREKEIMGAMRSSEMSDLISSGDIEGLDSCIKKWHMQYRDVRIQNGTPILHCAVESMQLPMIQFLISEGVDIYAQNEVNKITTANLK
jgi:hypothetical protein